MLEALQEQLEQADINALSFNERLALLVEREILARENRRLKTRLRQAKLKEHACLEDIDYQSARGLSKSVVLHLSDCQWVTGQQNLLITGPTGTGKTFLGCAFAHRACLRGFSARYARLPRLFEALTLAKGDGSYSKLMARFAKTHVLLLDDWGLTTMDANQSRDLLEILDDRHNQTSTIVTSQLPLSAWHEAISDPTLGDAILDRLVHNAHKLELKGESMRKKQAKHLIKEEEVS
jgi:DNA replication protein DnaC